MSIARDAAATRQASIGWLIQRLAGRLDRTMSAALAEHELTILQFAILMAVFEHGAPSQSEIGRRFGAPAYAVSRALDELQARGLVARKPHPASRRAHVVEATAAGRELAPRLFEVVRGVNADFAAPLSEAERETLQGLLWRVLAHHAGADFLGPEGGEGSSA